MMSLGIERNSFLAYEGMFSTGRGIWPSPVITSVAAANARDRADATQAQTRRLAGRGLKLVKI